jgi:rhodanese-related sulfurtransferase
MLAKTAAHLVAEATAHIESLSPEEVARELRLLPPEPPSTGGGSLPLLVDVREPEERLTHGSIPGAVHAPRGMLEFAADPTSAYHRAEFDPYRRTILYCASGGRSALAAATLRTLGYARVAHLEGGLKAWREAGLTVDPGS